MLIWACPTHVWTFRIQQVPNMDTWGILMCHSYSVSGILLEVASAIAAENDAHAQLKLLQ